MSQNDALFERAQKTIPGGVNSPVRAFRQVGGTPRFVTRDRKSTRLNSSHSQQSRMPSSA